jgi:O-antigen/teichoic acid export membrane protein
LANLATKPIWFLFIVFSIRELGSVAFGQYAYLLALCGIVLATFEGGVDIHTIRTLSDDPTRIRSHHRVAIRIKLIGILLSMTVLGFLVGVLGYGEANAVHMAWVLLMLASLAMIMHYRAYFRAMDRFRFEAYSITLEKGIASGFGFAALMVGGGLDVFLPVFALGYVAALGSTYLLFRTLPGTGDVATTGTFVTDTTRFLGQAFPFAYMNILLNYRTRIPSILLQHMGGRPDWVGYYNSGYRLVEAYALIPSLLAAPLLPDFVKSSHDPDRLRKVLLNSLKFLLTLSTGVALFLSLFGGAIIPIAFGPGYLDAIPTIRIAIWAIVPISANYVTGALVSALGRQSRANRFLSAELVIMILLFGIGIHLNGFEGAAWALVAAESVYLGLQAYLLRDMLTTHALIAITVKLSVICGLVTSMLMIGAAAIPPLVQWVMVPILFAGGVMASGLVRPSELTSIFHSLRGTDTKP